MWLLLFLAACADALFSRHSGHTSSSLASTSARRTWTNGETRIAQNQRLGELLRQGLIADATELVRSMDESNQTGADTVNILLTDCLRRRRSLVDAEKVFRKYFGTCCGSSNILSSMGTMKQSQADSISMSTITSVNAQQIDDSTTLTSLKRIQSDSNQTPLMPSTVSLNIMAEACREWGESARLSTYLRMFDVLGLKHDRYTYSTMVRATTNESEIVRLLAAAKRDNQLTAPLLRASILSLGQRGVNPSDIMRLSTLFEGSSFPTLCTLSADVIVSSLLQNKTAIQLTSPFSPYNGLSGYDLAIQGIQNGSFKVSDRGYSAVFTYIQRKGKVMGVSASIRDELWTRVCTDIEGGVLALNGRLADAYLRCYGEDVRGAMRAWRLHIQPYLKRLSSDIQRKEVTVLSMQAIMYLTGLVRRPDIALEVVYAIRGKKWSVLEKQSLAKAYVHGRNRANKYGIMSVSAKVSDFLLLGFERSVESELGVLLANTTSSLQNIRIILA